MIFLSIDLFIYFLSIAFSINLLYYLINNNNEFTLNSILKLVFLNFSILFNRLQATANKCDKVCTARQQKIA